MKPLISKRLLIAGIALLTVPSALLAQDDKDKDKDKKEKNNVQQIIITRNGENQGKTVIEIDGDKVKVNGKDVKDNKDVSVRVNTLTGTRVRPGTWSYNFNNNDHNMSLFKEDSNRAMLGVNTEENDKGAEVESVIDESAAEKAGLKKGDVITKIAKTKIESSDDLTEEIRSHKPGEKVAITFLRDGKEQTVTAELGKWKGIPMESAMAMPRIEQFGGTWAPQPPSVPGNAFGYTVTGRPRLGLSIQDTDDGIGVKVLDVDEESNAAKAGIKEGDIIVGVDDHEVKGTDDVTKALREREKNSFNFKIKRDGKTQNIEVKFPKKLKTADL